MNDFFTAHNERMKRNDAMFRELAGKLKEIGCTVHAPKNQLINFIRVSKDKKHVWINFEETPYRWTMGISIPPTKENGSGLRLPVTSYDLDQIFSVDVIMENLKGEYNNPFTFNFLKEL